MKISKVDLVQTVYGISSSFSLQQGDVIEDKGTFIKVVNKEGKVYLIPLSNIRIMEVLEDKAVETVKEKSVKKVKDTVKNEV